MIVPKNGAGTMFFMFNERKIIEKEGGKCYNKNTGAARIDIEQKCFSIFVKNIKTR